MQVSSDQEKTSKNFLPPSCIFLLSSLFSLRVISSMLQQYPLDTVKFAVWNYSLQSLQREKQPGFWFTALPLRGYRAVYIINLITWHSECSYIRWDAINHHQPYELTDAIVRPLSSALSKLTLSLHPWHQREGSRLPGASKGRQTEKNNHMTALLIYCIMALDRYIFCSCSTITIHQVGLALQRITF